MNTINRVEFKDLKDSNLFIDTVYAGGSEKNISSEVLSKLLTGSRVKSTDP